MSQNYLNQSAKLLSVVLLVLVASFVAMAQGPSSGNAKSANTLVGETLTYEAKLNRILRGISVAEMTISTAARGEGGVSITTVAVSKGTLLRLFRYSFLQQYVSDLDENFRILKTTKHDVQKQRVRDSEAIFDYSQRRVTYVERDPKDPMRPPRTIASPISSTMLDMVSAIYHLRLQQLTVGSRFDLEVSDSGLVYRVPVVVAAREMQKTEIGNVMCFRLEPEIFGPDRLIEQKGKMFVWYTADDRRIPVRSTIDSEVGKIEVKLRSRSVNGIRTLPVK